MSMKLMPPPPQIPFSCAGVHPMHVPFRRRSRSAAVLQLPCGTDP